MSLKSMTGFARRDGALGSGNWHWEVRSVNGRGLDVRLRFPPGYEALETKVRDAVGQRLTRGSIAISLQAGRETGQSEVRLNERALAQVIKAADRIRELTGADPARADGLLALKGVLEVADESDDPAAVEATHTAMLETFAQVLDGVVAARAAEGGRLAAVIAAQVDEIERLTGIVEASPARSPQAIAARLKELVGRIVETGNGLDETRLHQEAVLMATRADVEEELRRLRMHIAAARDLLAESGPVGRKFDFLAQEFNREANTLCSKANDTEISRAGLALKVVIDQMREQVQNLE